jgi:hypothetical protein
MRDWRKYFRGFRWRHRSVCRLGSCTESLIPPLLLLILAAIPVAARGRDKVHYGEGLIVNIPIPESEVQQVVQEITQNGLIRGTKEYNKDEFVSGAKAATSTRAFPPWTEGGKVFYKVREQAIDPRNFKDSSDVGTLAVRYVVQPQGEKNTVLRIDALFEEDYRHIVHKSNGSVESSEYKDIQEHLEAIEVMKQQNVESEKERQDLLAKKHKATAPTYAPTETAEQSSSQALSQTAESGPAENPPAESRAAQTRASESRTSEAGTSESHDDSASQTAVAQSQGPVLSNQSAAVGTQLAQTLEDHVKELRKQVERLVKAPGAPLKSAPFHTASTLQTLNPHTEVLILISTPYWYGVETHEGQHGWIMRDEVEQP